MEAGAPNTRVEIQSPLTNWDGCVQLRSEGTLEPLNAAALPPGGLRQDHHGVDQMPVSPGDALPFHANLMPFDARINTTGGGVISLLVAPDNSSIVRPPSELHMTL